MTGPGFCGELLFSFSLYFKDFEDDSCSFNSTLPGSFYARLHEYVGSGMLLAGYQVRLPMTPVDREVKKFCLILKKKGIFFDVRQDPRGYSVQVLR